MSSQKPTITLSNDDLQWLVIALYAAIDPSHPKVEKKYIELIKKLIAKQKTSHNDKHKITTIINALECALKTMRVARRYFPKSIKNKDTFNLETSIAAIGTALHNCREESSNENHV